MGLDGGITHSGAANLALAEEHALRRGLGRRVDDFRLALLRELGGDIAVRREGKVAVGLVPLMIVMDNLLQGLLPLAGGLRAGVTCESGRPEGLREAWRAQLRQPA